jgi:hypothetical protein
MKINHEETKKTKKEPENLRALRFFVVDFRRSHMTSLPQIRNPQSAIRNRKRGTKWLEKW